MSQRSKNLLEAFNQSKAPEKSAEPVAQPRGSAPRVGGPFADSAPAARWRVVVLCAGIAVIFFYIGRVSAPSVQAAGESQAAATGTIPNTPPASAPQRPTTSNNDSALKDPKNQYTLLAVTYDKFTAETERLAEATKARLISLNLPASISKNKDRKLIYVLVGAAPKISDLDPLLARLQAATSDRGKKDFQSAHSAPIINYVVR